MLRLTETYTLCIFRTFSAKYSPMHASKKEMKNKSIRGFLGAWTFHTHTHTHVTGHTEVIRRNMGEIRR